MARSKVPRKLRVAEVCGVMRCCPYMEAQSVPGCGVKTTASRYDEMPGVKNFVCEGRG